MKKILSILFIAVFILGLVSVNAKEIKLDIIEDYKDIIITNGREDEKKLALTFDDGPDEDFTPQVLEILKKHNVKATFFVMGQKVKYYKSIVKEAFNDGHEIANHTFTHINVSKRSFEEINSEIVNTQNIIKEVTGQYPTSFRPPYRAISKNMCDIAKKNNMDVILWANIDPRDWSNPGVNYIVDNILDNVKNGNIILLHDYNKVRNNTSQTVQALDLVIPKLKEQGFEFVTIKELKDSLK